MGNLKKLEETLQKKHEGQLHALNDLLEHHQGQLKKQNEDHEVEKEKVISEWQKKLENELMKVKSEHDQEMMLKNLRLNQAETELKHQILEIETKDKNVNEMTAFIETTSAEYNTRLNKIRKDFEEKLEEIKSNVDSSHEVELRGIQELLSKQRADEIERLKVEHEKVKNDNLRTV